MKKLRDFLASKPSMRILDIGTGSGAFVHQLAYLSNDYAEIIGIDTSDRAIAAAQNNFDDPRITFLNMDALAMTFEPESFDLVCLSNSLHHLSDITTTIRAMESVLKPGGALIFNEMYADVSDPMRKTHVLMHHFWGRIDTDNGLVHNETFKRQMIIDILRKESHCTLLDTWDMVIEDEHVMGDKDYEYLNNILDQYVNKVKDESKRSAYEEEAKNLRQRLDNVGFKSATQLLVTLKK